jgi:riboflavin kinase / FMN adenylyltransferase
MGIPMKIIYGLNFNEIARPTVTTLGIFDGLHRGHQEIMKFVVARARAINAVPTALTFSPHPRAILRPETAPPLLQTLEQRAACMSSWGIEQLIVLEFTPQLAAMSAADFTQEILVTTLQSQEVYLGQGFAFGRGREGNIERLQHYSQHYGFTSAAVPEVRFRNHRVSSTLIRRLLKAGRVNLARQFLGRPYSLSNTVIAGNKLARQLQFPTANLLPPGTVLPLDGVYITVAAWQQRYFPSITNIGVRPTIAGNQRLVETHIFDFAADLYDSTLTVYFLHRLRAEQKFTGLPALQQQIELDCQQARCYFQRAACQKLLQLARTN